MKKILAFETSCDDTAVAIVDDSGRTHGEAIFSQVKEHMPFLGVVPEIGSRAHIEQIIHVTRLAFKQSGLMMSDIDAVAATFAPGLIGPLLVGAQFAKGIALAAQKPLIAVHHIEGHIFSGWNDHGYPRPPFAALIASGGHTAIFICDQDYRVRLIGETLDDAAGEAFDKVGRALGLGYPAGKIIDQLAREGDASRFKFSVALREQSTFNFSFSGLKTQCMESIRAHAPFNRSSLTDFCAGLELAIATPLCHRLLSAASAHGLTSVVIGGGVAANTKVRQMLSLAGHERGIKVYLPPLGHCTDNAVMIAKAAHIRLSSGHQSDLSMDVRSQMAVENSWELLAKMPS